MAGPCDFSQRVQECTDRLSVTGVDALASLFDLTSNRLVRFALAITRHQHDAEDAVQTALVRVAREPRVLTAAS
jgi:RNA polymerase sigma-70 factor (ECF subfamily)